MLPIDTVPLLYNPQLFLVQKVACHRKPKYNRHSLVRYRFVLEDSYHHCYLMRLILKYLYQGQFP